MTFLKSVNHQAKLFVGPSNARLFHSLS